MIVARDLQKGFGKVTAVQSVSFEAPDGQITGLLGPNGAGKTTTMRMLCGLMSPDAGSITIGSHDVATQAQAVRRDTGILPDARGLYVRLTARENIEYFGSLHGLSKKQIADRIARLVELLDMKEIIERKTEGFSQGERMKVSIARALVHDPSHMLLDEPTNGLDVMSTRGMRTFIRQLREAGKCVVLSTHVMQEVTALCDRIVVVSHGRVTAEGTAEELLVQTGTDSLEDAFVSIIGSGEGLAL